MPQCGPALVSRSDAKEEMTSDDTAPVACSVIEPNKTKVREHTLRSPLVGRVGVGGRRARLRKPVPSTPAILHRRGGGQRRPGRNFAGEKIEAIAPAGSFFGHAVCRIRTTAPISARLRKRARHKLTTVHPDDGMLHLSESSGVTRFVHPHTSRSVKDHFRSSARLS